MEYVEKVLSWCKLYYIPNPMFYTMKCECEKELVLYHNWDTKQVGADMKDNVVKQLNNKPEPFDKPKLPPRKPKTRNKIQSLLDDWEKKEEKNE